MRDAQESLSECISEPFDFSVGTVSAFICLLKNSILSIVRARVSGIRIGSLGEDEFVEGFIVEDLALEMVRHQPKRKAGERHVTHDMSKISRGGNDGSGIG